MSYGNPTTPHARGVATPKSKQKPQNFSFPLLPTKDILICLAELELGVTITEAELAACEKHPAIVRRLFENLLEALTATRKDELNMPVFEAHQNLAYPQLHEDSIPEMAFWRAMSKLMATCGVADFCRDDLSRPDPKRLKKQLSGLINFAKFREERYELYQRITSERDGGLDRLGTVEAENAYLGETLSELRVATKSQREEIKALDERIAAAKALVQAKNEEQARLRVSAAELKEANVSLKEGLGEASLEHSALLAEVKKLQSQVVHSPERVRREMHESQRALQQERRDGEAAEAAALTSATASKAVADATAKVKDAHAAVEDILDLSNACIEVSQAIKAREESIVSNRKVAGKLADEGVEVERQNARLAEKLAASEQQAEMKAAHAARDNEALRAKLLEQRRRKAAAASAHGEEDRECEALAARLEAEQAEQRRKMAELYGAWRRLEATVQEQQRALFGAVASTGPAAGSAGAPSLELGALGAQLAAVQLGATPHRGLGPNPSFSGYDAYGAWRGAGGLPQPPVPMSGLKASSGLKAQLPAAVRA